MKIELHREDALAERHTQDDPTKGNYTYQRIYADGKMTEWYLRVEAKPFNERGKLWWSYSVQPTTDPIEVWGVVVFLPQRKSMAMGAKLPDSYLKQDIAKMFDWLRERMV